VLKNFSVKNYPPYFYHDFYAKKVVLVAFYAKNLDQFFHKFFMVKLFLGLILSLFISMKALISVCPENFPNTKINFGYSSF